MKALVLEEQGKLKSLTVKHDREKPIPKENEIRIKVEAAGLNPSDYQVASYPDLASERKRVLGLEAAGIVDAVGSEVSNFKVGDRVYYLRSIANLDGGFAEYAITTAHTASKLPEAIPYEVAAVIPGAGFTAYQAIIQKIRPQAESTILIHGGAGGVGGYAIQLAKLCGLTVYTTCLSRDIEYVKGLGADVAIDFEKEDVCARIKGLTNNRGVDYVLNTVGSEVATKDIDILAFGGEIAVTAGFPDFNRLHFFEKGLSLYEIALGAEQLDGDYKKQCKLAQIGDEFAQLLVEKKIVPPAIKEISMEEIPEYLVKLSEGKITGKVVAKINS
jgi:NADPH:quinone reductase and related Zn-dependent oxidoreductases